VGHLLRRTDMVATVTERLAESLVEPFDLTYLPHPVELPEIAINVFWHAKVHRSPAHQWLRGVVFDLFGDKQASAASTAVPLALRLVHPAHARVSVPSLPHV
jgi:DNA-binding transcriptional LysR family regulator